MHRSCMESTSTAASSLDQNFPFPFRPAGAAHRGPLAIELAGNPAAPAPPAEGEARIYWRLWNTGRLFLLPRDLEVSDSVLHNQLVVLHVLANSHAAGALNENHGVPRS